MKVEIEKNLLKDIERCPEGGGGQVEKQQADVDAVLFLILTLCAIKWNINLVNIFVVQSINEP